MGIAGSYFKINPRHENPMGMEIPWVRPCLVDLAPGLSARLLFRHAEGFPCLLSLCGDQGASGGWSFLRNLPSKTLLKRYAKVSKNHFEVNTNTQEVFGWGLQGFGLLLVFRWVYRRG